MKTKIGIIGFGNMGRAIAEQLKADYTVLVFDKDKNKLKSASGITLTRDNIGLIKEADILILAIKPQDFDSVLREIKDYVEQKLVISIAAGITTNYIESRLNKARVVRVMPNLPLKVGKGMICLCRSKSVTAKDLIKAKQLFKNLGRTLLLGENMMNAATVISGSGPGYLYDWAEGKTIEEVKEYAQNIFIPSLTQAAKVIGFTSRQAKILAEITAEGSIFYLKKIKLSAKEAKQQVASKGGTTEAGLEVLHRGGSLEDAVKIALRRAEKLSSLVQPRRLEMVKE